MRSVVAVIPLVLSLTGCAAFLNKQIGDPGLENSVAALPIDSCPNVGFAGDNARLTKFRELKLSPVSRDAEMSDLEMGKQIIAGSTKEKFSADSEMVEKALGIDLEQ